ncbi:MAG: hypothetical protein LBJ13_01890 [Puniceicoccales bacterium]|jgi:hypothetical protein|nr:hypothetical protein [Puniceicoccales bacterium]
MESSAEKLIKYVLEKLEAEPVEERVRLYDVLAGFMPDEEASSKLRECSEELRQIDLKIQGLKSFFFLTNKHENYECKC